MICLTVVRHKSCHVHVHCLNCKERNEDADKKVSPLLELISAKWFLGPFISVSFSGWVQKLVLGLSNVKSIIHIFVNAFEMLFMIRHVLPLVILAEYALPLCPAHLVTTA